MLQHASNIEIVLDDVGYEQSGKHILNGISLHLSARRIGVIGRNGSGKTSLSRIIAGLSEPTAGALKVAGLNPAKQRREVLKTIGVLFQNPDHQIIFPTVIEEVSFGLSQMGMTKADAENEALSHLNSFGVTHWKDAHVARLSQGQKQLVCLISILAMHPKLILLDEPFAGLDIPTRMQLIRRLDAYEGTILHVTHRPDDLDGYDHVVWLNEGTVSKQGSPNTVLPVFVDAMEKIGAGNDLFNLAD